MPLLGSVAVGDVARRRRLVNSLFKLFVDEDIDDDRTVISSIDRKLTKQWNKLFGKTTRGNRIADGNGVIDIN